MIFEKFDDPKYANDKISIAERLIIKAAVVLAKMLIGKFGKVKTYGEMQSLLEKINTRFEEEDSNFERNMDSQNLSDDVAYKDILDKIKNFKL